jgi:peptide/nickel transport system permease protein
MTNITLSAPSLDYPEGADVTPQEAAYTRPRRRIPFAAIFGTLWIVAVLVLTILATYFPSAVPFIRDYDTRVKVNGHTKAYGLGPGWTAWWGLDKSSYDVFSRCMYGARVTLTIGVGATVIGLVVGGTLGLMAGYFRGWPDRVVSILTDALLALPALLLALILVYRLDDLRDRFSYLHWADRMWSITITLGILSIAPLARIVRAQAISLREREFVLAARSLGAGRTRIMVREILPNLVPAMVTVAFTGLGILVAAEGALAFLGLGVERPQTWGKMIANSQTDLDKAWWATIFPCIMLFMTVLAFNMIGDELARRFDIREAAV